MKIYFTSDTHFGHNRIIDLCKRPFASVHEMDAVLIEKWNETVAPNDIVYHLGDFACRNERPEEFYRAQLNGAIHLIAGNHDDEILNNSRDLFASISDIKSITIQDQKIILCHYPMREWSQAWRGSWHLFGHVHGHLDDDPIGPSLDVGVDSHNFTPISFEDVKEVMNTSRTPFRREKSELLK